MQVKTTVRCHLTLVRIAIIKKSTNNKCWRGCGEKVILLHCWNVSWCSHFGEQCGGSIKNLKIELCIWFRDPIPRHISRENNNLKNTCTSVFTASLSKIAKTWKQCKCPLIDEWIKKMRYTYTMEYYSAEK